MKKYIEIFDINEIKFLWEKKALYCNSLPYREHDIKQHSYDGRLCNLNFERKYYKINPAWGEEDQKFLEIKGLLPEIINNIDKIKKILDIKERKK